MPSATRVAKNESLFRELNERINELAESFRVGRNQQQLFVCECSRTGCSEPIELTLAEYAAVRTKDVQFAVSPGHFDPSHEKIVLRKAPYWVVEKDGLAAEVATEAEG